MKGLSSGTLQKVTILAEPIDRGRPCDATRRAALGHRITASMLMPARVEATLTDEQTRCVSAMAWGMASISAVSRAVKPFCTSAEKPPTKSMPISAAAASRA